MDVEKDAFNTDTLSSPDYTEDTTNELMPPPYMDEPPAYSTVVENSTAVYYSSQTIPDYMSKLPFGQPSNISPLPPSEVQSYSQQSFNPQVGNEQLSSQQAIYHHPTNSTLVNSQFPHQSTHNPPDHHPTNSTLVNSQFPHQSTHNPPDHHPTNSTLVNSQFPHQSTHNPPDLHPTNSTLVNSHFPQQPNHNPPTAAELNSNPTILHKVLNQPSSSCIVETTVIGHRKKKSHVKDLATGKEYIVEEKTSRSGKKNKAVIKEVGGPKTYVKETPSKTVICQKKS